MEITRTPAPSLSYVAEMTLDGLRYGHSRAEAVKAFTEALENTWETGYSHGQGDILAGEVDRAGALMARAVQAAIR